VAVVVRSAEPSETKALEALELRSSFIWEDYREDLLAHPDSVEVPKSAVLAGRVRVAVRDGRVVGFSVLVRRDDEVAELDGLFVEPDQILHGVGRALMADFVAMARHQRAGRIEVTANPKAAGFYEKLGFVADGPVATRFGPALRMHFDL
jgi:GNAT superfamily N-acetyltransferase